MVLTNATLMGISVVSCVVQHTTANFWHVLWITRLNSLEHEIINSLPIPTEKQVYLCCPEDSAEEKQRATVDIFRKILWFIATMFPFFHHHIYIIHNCVHKNPWTIISMLASVTGEDSYEGMKKTFSLPRPLLYSFIFLCVLIKLYL